MKEQKWHYKFTDQEKAEFKREYPQRLHNNIFLQRSFVFHLKARKTKKFERMV